MNSTASLVDVLVPIAALAALILLEMPIAFALGLSGCIGLALNGGVAFVTSTLGTIPYDTVGQYSFIIIPLFILMGTLVANSGMLSDIFDVVQRRVGRVPGGVAVATVISCTFFGGITGSSVADAATFGRLSIAEMSRRGYERGYAASVVASASTVAVLIPPSITLVVYAVLTQQSVNQLLLAGLLPGLVTVVAYTTTVIYSGLRHPEFRGERGVAFAGSRLRPWYVRYYGGGVAVLLFLVVVGGIYSGLYTATEASASGAMAALITSSGFVMLSRSRAGIRSDLPSAGQVIFRSLRDAASLAGMVFALLIGAALFTQYLVLDQVPASIAHWATGLPLPNKAIIAVLLVGLVPLGMVMEGLSMLLVVAPIVYPIVTSLGFSGIWFGVLMVKIIEIGLIAPPLGLNVFAVASMVPDLSPGAVFRRIPRFLLAELGVVAVVFAFPAVATVIPNASGVH